MGYLHVRKVFVASHIGSDHCIIKNQSFTLLTAQTLCFRNVGKAMLFAVFGGRKMPLIWVQKIRPSRIFPGKAVLNNSSSIQGIKLEDIRFQLS